MIIVLERHELLKKHRAVKLEELEYKHMYAWIRRAYSYTQLVLIVDGERFFVLRALQVPDLEGRVLDYTAKNMAALIARHLLGIAAEVKRMRM